MSTSEAATYLRDYFVNLSTSRMHKHCPSMQFEAFDIESYHEGKVMGDEISMIMLWGEIGSVILKTHFDLTAARHITAEALGQIPEAISDEMVRAYLNEYNNLMGGFFRGILDSQNVLVGMSLPFTTSGKHELCFFKIRDNRYVFTKWKIKSNKGHIIHCTSEILLVNSESLMKCKQNLNDCLTYDGKDNGGDVEYL